MNNEIEKRNFWRNNEINFNILIGQAVNIAAEKFMPQQGSDWQEGVKNLAKEFVDILLDLRSDEELKGKFETYKTLNSAGNSYKKDFGKLNFVDKAKSKDQGRDSAEHDTLQELEDKEEKPIPF